jgi:hypothetical protein
LHPDESGQHHHPMGLLDRLKRAFGGSTAPRDDGMYYYVRCDRCGDRVRVRVAPNSELQQEFDGGDRVSGYSVRKIAVDSRCFRPIELTLRFDAGKREQDRQIQGGAFLTREEFEAEPPAG